MDRKDKISKHYQIDVNKALRHLMSIMDPGEELKWGAKKHEEIVGYAACYLAVEYQALTGTPIIQLLSVDREIDDPTPSPADVAPEVVLPVPEEVLPI